MKPEEMDALISAYVDGELTQQDEQKVRLYVEKHPEAAKAMEDYVKIKGDVRKLKFDEPTDEEWEDFETPRGSRKWRTLGLVLIIAGYFALCGFGLYEFFTEDGPLFPKILVGAITIGFGILLTSVVRQRFLELKTDKYTRVGK